MRKHVHTITRQDVGKTTSVHEGRRTFHLSEAIGKILPCDVGKRVYIIFNEDPENGVLQVENDAQRTDRRSRGEED